MGLNFFKEVAKMSLELLGLLLELLLCCMYLITYFYGVAKCHPRTP